MLRTNNKALIYIGETHLCPWKEIDKAKIYLNQKGEIIVNELIIPDNRHRDCKDKFNFLKEYLERKKLPYNVAEFEIKNLRNIFTDMEKKKQKTISYAKLHDIYHYQNYIVGIKEEIFKRIEKFVKRKYRKEL